MSSPSGRDEERYVRFFHELDAWTEYWDIYHPETRGRFYFGDGAEEPGLLTFLLPRERRPEPFSAWIRMASFADAAAEFRRAVEVPAVWAALTEIDTMLDRIFCAHFGKADDPDVRVDYLRAMFRFATNALPAATERLARIPAEDFRKATAGRHTLDGDLMWFAWALVLEGASLIAGEDHMRARRSLMLAGVAVGCSADFAWRGHRRTRSEYEPSAKTARLLHDRGLQWANEFRACALEVHGLFRIREWGDPS